MAAASQNLKTVKEINKISNYIRILKKGGAKAHILNNARFVSYNISFKNIWKVRYSGNFFISNENLSFIY